MRCLTLLALPVALLTLPLSAEAGWWHRHHGCCYYYPAAPVAVAPTTVLGATALPTTVLGASTFSFAPATVSVLPTTTLGITTLGATTTNTATTSDVSSVHAAGMKSAFDLLLPLLEIIIKAKTGDGAAPGCGCGKEPADVLPPGGVDGVEQKETSTGHFISAERDFQDKATLIGASQQKIEDGLSRLEKLYPAQ
ncbi:MAG: hypothetical protein SFU86_00805 [Pirellulaceae bacterium]|nr:hypothetical protein [Pirellulaceae bacterium]